MTAEGAKEWYLKRNGLTATGQGLVTGAVTPELWYTETGDLFNRLGAYKDADYKGGIWASASYKKTEFDADMGDGLAPFDVKMNTITVGYDKKLNHSNGIWYYGIMGGYGKEKREADANIGNADTDSYHFSLYSVYESQNGLYISGLVKYNRYDTDITVNSVDRLSSLFGYDRITGGLNQNGLGLSLTAGKKFGIGNKGWYFEPQAQFSYMQIGGGSYTTNSGIDVDVKATNSVRAKAGFALGRQWRLKNGNMLEAYVDAMFNREFDGKTDVWMSEGKFTRELGDSWGSYGIGLNYRMSDNNWLAAKVGYGNGGGRTEPFYGTLAFLFEIN
jgi:outer membrane autotransporter protein